MTTNINISVQGRDLVERSKQQQRDARTKRLTTDSLTEEAEKNRSKILREVPTTDTAAQPRAIDTDTAPYVRSNRPSASRMADEAFLLVTVLNLDTETTYQQYTVGITGSDDVSYLLNGVPYAEGFLNRDRTFLYLPRNRTVEAFRRSAPYPYIYQTLDTYYSGGPVDPGTNEPVFYGVEFMEPVFRLHPFKPRRTVPYTVTLNETSIVIGGNAQDFLSSGVIIAGYLNSPTYYMDTWFLYNSITLNDVMWGMTNQNLIDFYPSDYPR